MAILMDWRAEYGPRPIGTPPMELLREEPALAVGRSGHHIERGPDEFRRTWTRDPVTGVPRPGLLVEPARTNMLGTEDLRKFIGWSDNGGTPTLTQGQTIPPTPDTDGSPVGEATRYQHTGGANVVKRWAPFGETTGQVGGSILVHNQGSQDLLVGLGYEGSTFGLTTIAPGETKYVRNYNMYNSENAAMLFATTDAGHDIDCLAWAPFAHVGRFQSTFPGITRTTRPIESAMIPWHHAPQDAVWYGEFTVGSGPNQGQHLYVFSVGTPVGNLVGPFAALEFRSNLRRLQWTGYPTGFDPPVSATNTWPDAQSAPSRGDVLRFVAVQLNPGFLRLVSQVGDGMVLDGTATLSGGMPDSWHTPGLTFRPAGHNMQTHHRLTALTPTEITTDVQSGDATALLNELKNWTG